MIKLANKLALLANRVEMEKQAADWADLARMAHTADQRGHKALKRFMNLYEKRRQAIEKVTPSRAAHADYINDVIEDRGREMMSNIRGGRGVSPYGLDYMKTLVNRHADLVERIPGRPTDQVAGDIPFRKLLRSARKNKGELDRYIYSFTGKMPRYSDV